MYPPSKYGGSSSSNQPNPLNPLNPLNQQTIAVSTQHQQSQQSSSSSSSSHQQQQQQSSTDYPRRESLVKPTWPTVVPGQVPSSALSSIGGLNNGLHDIDSTINGSSLTTINTGNQKIINSRREVELYDIFCKVKDFSFLSEFFFLEFFFNFSFSPPKHLFTESYYNNPPYLKIKSSIHTSYIL